MGDPAWGVYTRSSTETHLTFVTYLIGCWLVTDDITTIAAYTQVVLLCTLLYPMVDAPTMLPGLINISFLNVQHVRGKIPCPQ